ncbi:ABC transporter permease [Propionivibrio limicola]|uniref:ABC transporter permease n=1 Tax=Propionivibrio limicola TaxID=167645 RepID=UPI001290FE05|nr:MlaE family lipid ABC transporter permease subunit [Propionivibrio limicola]
MARPALAIDERVGKDGQRELRLSGDWTLTALPAPVAALQATLREHAARRPVWDLTDVARLDSAGAVLLWQAWGRRWPEALTATAEQRAILERAAALPPSAEFSRGRGTRAQQRLDWLSWPLIVVGTLLFKAVRNLREVVTLIGQLVLDLGYLFAHPRDIPWREFSATLYKSGALALPVTALVGFLIGIVLSYLSSLQLKTFGADIYIVNLLGISIIRELGPVIVAVLVAGRSGSAMTAQIGVMRVTEEIDALATMGISRTLRLVLPKVLALAVTMPLLVVWCAAAGIIGGMVSANVEMGLAYGFFIDTLPRVVPVANVWIGIGKGFLFGFLIALIACHFGLKVRPNTESLSARTTSSVVTAITVVIIVDAIFAVLTRGVGMPV